MGMGDRLRQFARGRVPLGGTGSGNTVGASASKPSIVDAGTAYRQGSYNDHIGEEPEISMEELVRRRATDLKFRLAVQMYTAYSVGVGMSHAAEQNREGKAALAIVEAFCEEQDLDSLNQRIAQDVWATGNAFVWPVGPARPRKIKSLRLIPVSSITAIKRAEDGDVEQYRQRTARGGDRHIRAGDILHFAWLPEDASAWGTGLGQPLARKGLGYKTANGKKSTRPPWFEISEMTDDVASKITYAGLPRYAVSMPGLNDDRMAEVNRVFDSLEPLQHVISNFEAKVETIALDTASRFDSFLSKLDNQMVAGVMSPIPRLWSSLNFTYASSKEALAATFPLVAMYQRAHARFLERQIYAPVLMQAGRKPAKAKLRVSWGTREPLDMEGLASALAALASPVLAGQLDPESVLRLVQEAGLPVEPAKEGEAAAGSAGAAEGGTMAKDLRDLRALRDEYKERRVPVSTLPPEEQYKALRLALLKKALGPHGGNGHGR